LTDLHGQGQRKFLEVVGFQAFAGNKFRKLGRILLRRACDGAGKAVTFPDPSGMTFPASGMTFPASGVTFPASRAGAYLPIVQPSACAEAASCFQSS
jgi:hypothetical protein